MIDAILLWRNYVRIYIQLKTSLLKKMAIPGYDHGRQGFLDHFLREGVKFCLADFSVKLGGEGSPQIRQKFSAKNSLRKGGEGGTLAHFPAVFFHISHWYLGAGEPP